MKKDAVIFNAPFKVLCSNYPYLCTNLHTHNPSQKDLPADFCEADRLSGSL